MDLFTTEPSFPSPLELARKRLEKAAEEFETAEPGNRFAAEQSFKRAESEVRAMEAARLAR